MTRASPEPLLVVDYIFNFRQKRISSGSIERRIRLNRRLNKSGSGVKLIINHDRGNRLRCVVIYHQIKLAILRAPGWSDRLRLDGFRDSVQVNRRKVRWIQNVSSTLKNITADDCRGNESRCGVGADVCSCVAHCVGCKP